MEYVFKRSRIDKFTKERMLDELEKAAQKFDYIEFGWRDFDKVANIGAASVKKGFGSWKKALKALKEHLNIKGLDLSPRKSPPNRIYSDIDIFNEIERIWIQLGHRPSRAEWELSSPKISYNGIKQRFGGWQKVCLKFIEYKMGHEIEIDEGKRNIEEKQEEKKKNNYEVGDTRSIPLGVRMKVMNRDNYRCVKCGRSPATDIGIKLHLDHKIPFSQGGKSTEGNLQTLCQDCNIGKGDKIL